MWRPLSKFCHFPRQILIWRWPLAVFHQTECTEITCINFILQYAITQVTINRKDKNLVKAITNCMNELKYNECITYGIFREKDQTPSSAAYQRAVCQW